MIRAFDFLETRCVVEFDDPVVGEWLDRLFWRFAAADHSPSVPTEFGVLAGDGYRLLVGAEEAHTGLSREEAVMRLLVALNRATVRNLKAVGIHGGAVLGPSGAVLFPGGPGAGKSTLTAACGQLGMGYMTDEIVVLLKNGLIRPFPKPLWLSSWSRSALKIDDASLAFVARGFKAPVTPEDLGATTVDENTKLSHIVLIDRSNDNAGIDTASPTDGAAGMMANIYHLGQHSRIAFSLAAEAVRQVPVFRLTLGNPLKAAETLMRALAN